MGGMLRFRHQSCSLSPCSSMVLRNTSASLYQDKVLTLGNSVKKSLIEIAIHKIVLVKTDGISVSFQQVINMASCLVTAIAAVADENVVDY